MERTQSDLRILHLHDLTEKDNLLWSAVYDTFVNLWNNTIYSIAATNILPTLRSTSFREQASLSSSILQAPTTSATSPLSSSSNPTLSISSSAAPASSLPSTTSTTSVQPTISSTMSPTTHALTFTLTQNSAPFGNWYGFALTSNTNQLIAIQYSGGICMS